MDDWNDLRLILAIARAGSLTGAAHALGIDHSTVFRRLQALEGRLGVRLFERLSGGQYEPTDAGGRAAAAAERMEDEAQALDRDIAGRDHRLTGHLRVASSETLAHRLLTDHLAAFRRAHPGIVVELAIDNRVLSLSRREADVALRPLRPKEGDLWGRKLCDVAWAVYGSRAAIGALAAEGEIPSSKEGLAHLPLVGWSVGIAGIGAADWLRDGVREDAVVYRSSSLVNQMAATRAGLGFSILPCYLGDPETDLSRLWPDPIPDLSRELWIVTHADLKRTARVRAFFDIVGDALVRQRPLFEGEQSPGQLLP
ncbi:LysR family transcriptional regulator [Inquilinus sp. CAU 1745]|uniref:LysR family transcriptional regulator n=1 Tax=Inquilinus sp. CAU 1745 TaxID=3140369 RepID=UPI00325B8E8B